MGIFDPLPGEIIADSSGGWLGGFTSNYVVPFDSTSFSLEYPVGWTNNTWYETTGCNIDRLNCFCSDCCGGHVADNFIQRFPDEIINPCFKKFTLDQTFGISVAPRICHFGCRTQIADGLCCCTHPCDTVRCNPNAAGQEFSPGWPLVMYGVANPSARIRVVADASGPPGYEAMNALEIDFLGVGFEGASFVGEGGGYDSSRPPGYNSNPDPIGTNPALSTKRSATNFTVEPGECYRATYYAKVVPDMFGDLCNGYALSTWISTAHVGLPNSFGPTTLILIDEWQKFDGTFTNLTSVPLVDPMITIGTGNTNRVDGRIVCSAAPSLGGGQFVYPPRGRIHIKGVHVAPCIPPEETVTTGVHMARRFTFE